ncbi:MAG: hypothetical protein AAFU70_03950, partial [Planctomycetota bacterium]
MQHRTHRNLALVAVLATAGSAAGQSATVTFDGLTPGSQFGNAFGDSPGDQLLIEDGVVVTLENYTQGAFTGFNSATAHTDPVAQAISNDAIRLSNLSLLFDYSGVGFQVTQVTFDYADFGGGENLGVNGSIVELNLLSSAPATIGGVNVFVNEGPLGNNVGG